MTNNTIRTNTGTYGVSDTAAIGPLMQGQAGVVMTFTLTDLSGTAVNLTGLTITGTITNNQTKATAALQGAIALVTPASGIFSWTTDADDVGTAGSFKVIFTVGTSLITLPAHLAIIETPAATTTFGAALVGVTMAEAAWLTAALAALPDAGDLANVPDPAGATASYVWTADGADGADWAEAAGGGVSDHGDLTGLTDDDHTGYAKLAGRAGGQSLIGGTAASDDLTLTSTSDATKGIIRLATGGGQVAIGTTGATDGVLEIVGGTGAADDQGVKLSGTYSTNTAHPHRVQTTHPLGVGKAVAAYDARLTVSGSSATTDHAVGFQSRINIAASGTMSHLYDIFCAPTLSAGTVTNRYGLYVDDISAGASTLTNNYGVYIKALARGATTNWGLYVAGNPSYFGGNITVGGGNKRIYGDTTTPYVELSNATGTTVAYGAACQLYLGGPIFFVTNSVQRMGVESAGYFWVGKRRTDAMAQFTDTHNTTNTARLTTIYGNNAAAGSTPAAGFGLTTQYQLQSSTTADTVAASLSVVWNDATHATRKADLVLNAYDTAVREGLRIRGNGSAAAIGFLGAAPAARQTHVADPTGGATVDAEARTAINSILTTLETFGFHATS